MAQQSALHFRGSPASRGEPLGRDANGTSAVSAIVLAAGRGGGDTLARMRDDDPRLRAISLGAALALPLLLAGCRDSKGGPNAPKLVPSALAASGCSGPDQVFVPPPLPSAVPLAALAIDPWSQVTAAGDAELLFATGAGATVVAIDVSGAAPVETVLVSPGTVDALLAGAAVPGPARLSGVAVLDAGALLVVEHASNTLLRVDRLAPEGVSFFAGEPNAVPGFADGFALAGQPPTARFSFGSPTQVAATAGADKAIFVADPGNHAVRKLSLNPPSAVYFVSTLAGSGAPFFSDGSLQQAGFDTPSGLSLTCSGTLLVSESGAAGAGGHRLRQIVLGVPSFFGPSGNVLTRAGDGTQATLQGNGTSAALAAPRSPLATKGSDTYWLDSASGILRRMGGAQDQVDCPLWPDCASAVAAGGDFTPGAALSLTQTPAGVLFVLDPDAATLWRVTP